MSTYEACVDKLNLCKNYEVDSSQKKPKLRSKCVDNISTETDSVILQSHIELMKR